MLRTAEEYLENANGFFYTEDFVYHRESVIDIINEARKDTAIEFFKWHWRNYSSRPNDEEIEERFETFFKENNLQ